MGEGGQQLALFDFAFRRLIDGVGDDLAEHFKVPLAKPVQGDLRSSRRNDETFRQAVEVFLPRRRREQRRQLDEPGMPIVTAALVLQRGQRLFEQGGMGAVYKARQKGLDRLVALKILSRELAADPAFAERFAREARALARLNHPHIVTIPLLGWESGFTWITMWKLGEWHDWWFECDGHRTAVALQPQLLERLQTAERPQPTAEAAPLQ